MSGPKERPQPPPAAPPPDAPSPLREDPDGREARPSEPDEDGEAGDLWDDVPV